MGSSYITEVPLQLILIYAQQLLNGDSDIDGGAEYCISATVHAKEMDAVDVRKPLNT